LNDCSISVIIPTLNESETIARTIELTRQIGKCEIIVVDGGSSDGTVTLTAGADRVLHTEASRALQQNSGAAASLGDVLLFLHADCTLAADAFTAIRSALQDPQIVGGCFDQNIDADGTAYRWLEWGNRKRVQFWKWAYGDQGIFVRKEVFNAIGGFPELALMEDLYLMKRLKKVGKIKLLDVKIHVSPRRWQKNGILQQTIRNWSLISLAHLGISPNRLARFYT